MRLVLPRRALIKFNATHALLTVHKNLAKVTLPNGQQGTVCSLPKSYRVIMECFQFFSEQTASHLCPSSALPVDLSALTTPNIYWVMAAVASLTLWCILWSYQSKRAVGVLPSPLFFLWSSQSSIADAERILCKGMTEQEYELLSYFGYLEIQSKLYPTLFYRLLRKRRVYVYYLCETGAGQRYQKLGELSAVTHNSPSDADSFLLHKWLIEADERAYLDSMNWVGHSVQTRLYQVSGRDAIQHICRNQYAATNYQLSVSS
jgi:hypothetical protein